MCFVFTVPHVGFFLHRKVTKVIFPFTVMSLSQTSRELRNSIYKYKYKELVLIKSNRSVYQKSPLHFCIRNSDPQGCHAMTKLCFIPVGSLNYRNILWCGKRLYYSHQDLFGKGKKLSCQAFGDRCSCSHC